jgi:putative endonuclease
MYYTYVLQSEKSGKLYIGHTENLERRLKEHNSNQTKSIKNKGPWNLIFKKEFQSRSDAMKFEAKLKSLKNRKYILDNLNNF